MFEGRSPACSQSCKIVRLPPSGIGSDSAICVYTWKAKQRSHHHLTHSHPCFYLIIADSSRIVSNLMRRMNCTRRCRMQGDNIVSFPPSLPSNSVTRILPYLFQNSYVQETSKHVGLVLPSPGNCLPFPCVEFLLSSIIWSWSFIVRDCCDFYFFLVSLP